MKISDLIKKLEEARSWEPQGEDLEVLIGETNGMLIDKIDVNVDTMNESRVCIIQAYTRLR